MTILLEDYFDFLSPDAIRIKGHRIGLEHVLEFYLDGYSAEEILREFPTLNLEKIHATLTYYWAHKAEVDDYLRRGREMAERAYQEWAANPSPVVQRLRALREQRAGYK